MKSAFHCAIPFHSVNHANFHPKFLLDVAGRENELFCLLFLYNLSLNSSTAENFVPQLTTHTNDEFFGTLNYTIFFRLHFCRT